VDGDVGLVTVSPGAGDFLVAEIRFPKVQALPAVIARSGGSSTSPPIPA